MAVFGDAAERVHRTVLAHGDRIDVQRPLAVFHKDGAVVDVAGRRNVVGHQVQVFESLGFALSGAVFSRQPPAVTGRSGRR